MNRRLLPLLLAALPLACKFNPHVPDGVITCGADQDCPGGFSCNGASPASSAGAAAAASVPRATHRPHPAAARDASVPGTVPATGDAAFPAADAEITLPPAAPGTVGPLAPPDAGAPDSSSDGPAALPDHLQRKRRHTAAARRRSPDVLHLPARRPLPGAGHRRRHRQRSGHHPVARRLLGRTDAAGGHHRPRRRPPPAGPGGAGRSDPRRRPAARPLQRRRGPADRRGGRRLGAPGPQPGRHPVPPAPGRRPGARHPQRGAGAVVALPGRHPQPARPHRVQRLGQQRRRAVLAGLGLGPHPLRRAGFLRTGRRPVLRQHQLHQLRGQPGGRCAAACRTR